ncbi:MAG: hypothetical protein M3Z20_18690 [Chloroflexota bacterium]|nr:hypothetical protein [Chloroflexota bacterium]
MPALPVSLMEPLWAQFAALLPEHPEVDPTHPLGCHRRRTPDRVVFMHVVDALVHGSGYERIATPGCSDRTIRRRVGVVPPDLPVHLDRGYAGAPVQAVLAEFGCTGVISPTATPASGHVGERWVVERTHSWLNAFGKLRRCPKRHASVELYLFLAASIMVIQQLLRAAFQTPHWSSRSTIPRLP